MSDVAWRASRAKRFQVAAITAVVSPTLAALAGTYRWERDGLEHLDEVVRAGRAPILALWHGRIFPSIAFFRDRGVVALTSENFDGEWTARVMRRFGYAAARGSTSRGGRRALLQLRRDMTAGKWAAFTVDGPRGPAYRVQAGAVWLAKATGNPVVPFHIEASRCWEMRSWDRMQIPKPWSRVAIAIGPPLDVAAEADADLIERARLELEQRLGAVQARALEMVGRGGRG